MYDEESFTPSFYEITADVNDKNITTLDGYNMSNINTALGLVVKYYTGLLDKNGNPAILHPLTVGCSMVNVRDKIVGLLHDIVEDGYVTLDELRVLFDPQIVEAIRILTHNKKYSYEEYINSIKNSNNPIAVRVKMTDLQHNLRRGRDGGHNDLVQKHTKALDILTSLPEDDGIRLVTKHNNNTSSDSNSSAIPDSESDDSDFDENGIIKSSEVLFRRKKRLEREWLQAMPQKLEDYLSENNHIFKKYEEKSTRFQIHDHIFDFFPLSEVLVLDGTEIEYASIKNVYYNTKRTYVKLGQGQEIDLSNFYIDIILEDDTNVYLDVNYDPYNVSYKIFETLEEIKKKNNKTTSTDNIGGEE